MSSTVNERIEAHSQINASCLINASFTLLSCFRRPSLMNALCLIDAPYENYSKIPGISKKEQNQSTHSVSCLINQGLRIFQIKVRIDNDNTKTLSEDSDIDVGI